MRLTSSAFWKSESFWCHLLDTWALRRNGFDLYITSVHVANSHILLGRLILLQDEFTM